MNDKAGFALLAIGLIACLGIAASDCINLRTVDKNGEGISDVEVFMDAIANKAGETNSTGYLFIPLGEDEPYIKDHAKTNDDVWNITTSKGTKAGWANVTVPPGTCQNVTISMLY